MKNKPFVPGNPASLNQYALPVDAVKSLCVVRDELRLFAEVTARHAAQRPEVLMCRSTLAHCFEHLAQRVEDIVNALSAGTAHQTGTVPPQSSALKH